MGFYRVTRNLEASLIKFLEEQFVNENWTGITVEKSFLRAYTLAMKMDTMEAVLCIRASKTDRKRIEVGSDDLLRSQLILIDIFATNDGQREDLVDFIITILKGGFPYLEIQTEKSVSTSEIENGRVTILNIDDEPVNFSTDKSALDLPDRYRHLISITVSTGKVE